MQYPFEDIMDGSKSRGGRRGARGGSRGGGGRGRGRGRGRKSCQQLEAEREERESLQYNSAAEGYHLHNQMHSQELYSCQYMRPQTRHHEDYSGPQTRTKTAAFIHKIPVEDEYYRSSVTPGRSPMASLEEMLHKSSRSSRSRCSHKESPHDSRYPTPPVSTHTSTYTTQQMNRAYSNSVLYPNMHSVPQNNHTKHPNLISVPEQLPQLATMANPMMQHMPYSSPPVDTRYRDCNNLINVPVTHFHNAQQMNMPPPTPPPSAVPVALPPQTKEEVTQTDFTIETDLDLELVESQLLAAIKGNKLEISRLNVLYDGKEFTVIYRETSKKMVVVKNKVQDKAVSYLNAISNVNKNQLMLMMKKFTKKVETEKNKEGDNEDSDTEMASPPALPPMLPMPPIPPPLLPMPAIPSAVLSHMFHNQLQVGNAPVSPGPNQNEINSGHATPSPPQPFMLPQPLPSVSYQQGYENNLNPGVNAAHFGMPPGFPPPNFNPFAYLALANKSLDPRLRTEPSPSNPKSSGGPGWP